MCLLVGLVFFLSAGKVLIKMVVSHVEGLLNQVLS